MQLELNDKRDLTNSTDEHYTPTAVYDAVKNWCIEEYKLNEADIVRPFFPGGDYESYKYKATDAVVDNPPFSILSEIVDFYNAYNIKYFLFGPHLTVLSLNFSGRVYTSVLTASNIHYESDLNLLTSFVTNMEPSSPLLRTAPKLLKAIEEAQGVAPTKRGYHKNFIESSRLNNICCVDFQLNREEGSYWRSLDSMYVERHPSGKRKGSFGGSFLISEKASKRLEEARVEAFKQKQKERQENIKYGLSERELHLISQLE